MKIYNIEYIRDITEYNKIVIDLNKYGNYNGYEIAVENIFFKIKESAIKGNNSASYSYSFYKEYKEQSIVLIIRCANILCNLLNNFKYHSEIINNSNNVEIKITW